ncbi:MAG: glutamine amidotransferase [Phycisphaerae bacterium]
METFSLQFEAVPRDSLMFAILAGVILLLIGAGIGQLLRRRWRWGLYCLAAAAGPVGTGVALLGDGIRSTLAGRRQRALRAAAAGAGLVALCLAGWLGLRAAEYDGSLVWMTVLGLWMACGVGVIYGAVYGVLGPARATALMILRIAAVLLLLALLFKPVLQKLPSPDALKPILPILVDRSASMGTTDGGSAGSRYARSVQMLQSQAPQIHRHFRPVWVTFGRSARSADSLARLADLTGSADADGTDLAAAIRQVAGDYDPRDMPGMVMVSDGIHNAPGLPADAARQAGVPVFAAGIGSDVTTAAGRRNLRIETVSAPLEAVVNNRTTLTVRVRSAALAAVPAEIRLLEGDSNTPIDTARLWTDKDLDTLSVSLDWTPTDRPGASTAPAGNVRKLRLEVPALAGEVDPDDNSAEIHVLVTQPQVAVLYIEGTVRPEYKFLRRVLATDPNLEMISMVRISGNRFLSQGTIHGKKLTELPTTDEQLAMFDVVILGDLDATFLTAAQMSKLRNFVDRGGGLVMIGGHSSFGPGGYADTPIEALLPVLVGQRSQPQETTAFLPQLTAAGTAHPIFAGIEDYFPGPGGKNPPAEMALPELKGCVTVVGSRAGASLLAVHPSRRNANGPLVVLATGQFGKGRSAAFTADTTWRWFLPLQGRGADGPYRRFWGQLLRWLAGVEAKSRKAAPSALLRLEPSRNSFRLGAEPLKLRARVQGADGRVAEDAKVIAIARRTDGDAPPVRIPLSAGEGGLYEAEWTPDRSGRYELNLQASDAEDRRLGSDALTLRIEPRSAEMDNLARDDGTLQQIAQVSGGQYASLAGLPDLLDALIARQAERAGPAPSREVIPLHHFTLLFLLLVSLLTAEWLLRRRWQLQ